MGGPIELRPSPPPSASISDGNVYRQRFRAFIDGLHLAHAPSAPGGGMIDVALASMEAMQNTIARLKLTAYSPDVTIEIPRNASGFLEFWRSQELIG